MNRQQGGMRGSPHDYENQPAPPYMPMAPQPQTYTNNPYAVAPPQGGMYFGSPPMPGSLGTPHIGSTMWRHAKNNNNNNNNGGGGGGGGYHGQRVGSQEGRGSGSGSWRGGRRMTPKGRSVGNDGNRDVDTSNIILVPTRPLLKTLALECRPFPPWSVGHTAPRTMADEITLFGTFLQATTLEEEMFSSSSALVTSTLQKLWPNVELKPMGSQAAGLPHLKDFFHHFYALNSSEEGASIEEQQEKLREIANDNGVQVEISTDCRGVHCALLTDVRSSIRFAVRIGEDASSAAASSEIFEKQIKSVPDYRSTYIVVDALLRQNKALDDNGCNPKDISGESVATMLLAIINSYPEGDKPDPSRLLIDFFLTYGFSAHFDPSAFSVSYKGVDPPRTKVHRNAQLSILDPGDETKNLAPKLDKIAHLQAVFNYCYTAITQFSQVNANQRRAQSALSTIIGGETYWSRVLQLYQEEVSPYFEIVSDKKEIIVQAL